MPIEKRLKDLIEFVKCPETGSVHYGRWGTLNKIQRVYLDNLARDCLLLFEEMDKRIRTIEEIEEIKMEELKVGDTVYQVDNGGNIYEIKIKGLIYDCGHIAFDERVIGNSVFLTLEEAERKSEEIK